MLGGGNFTVQNKVMPGTYINFVSKSNGVNVFGERGVAAMAMAMNWSRSGIIEVTNEDFIERSLELFGYEYSAPELTDIREVFRNAKKLYLYNLNHANYSYASNTYCTAKNYGIRGNDLRISISTNVDNTSKKDVYIYLDSTPVFNQTVSSIKELDSNNYVSWNTSATLQNIALTNLTGGKNGTFNIAAVSSFFNNLDSYSFNALAVMVDDSDIFELVCAYTKRMRDEVGKKFQCITYDYNEDYEGVIAVLNSLNYEDSYHIMAWVLGAVAGCPVNKSLTNTQYTGEYEIDCEYSQLTLETAISKYGSFAFHNVNGETRVLLDINSLTTSTSEKGEDFKDNQTIRLCDQIAGDLAEIFNNYYLGKVPNDSAGRNSLWCDIVKHHQKLKDIRAIDDFDETAITVTKGENNKSVVINDCITPANAMTKLYMTVTIN